MASKLVELMIKMMGSGTATPLTGITPPTAGVADETVRDQEARDAKLRRKGRAAYILTGDQGAGTPQTAAKTLTGE